jgi:hypothetical protein
MSLDPRMTDELLLKYASNADKETVESEITERIDNGIGSFDSIA